MKTLLAIHEVGTNLKNLAPVILQAEEMSAHLDILVLAVARSVPATAAPGVPALYYDEFNAGLIADAKAEIEEIEAMLQKTDLSASVSLECKDSALIEQTVLQHALLADATVFRNQSVLEHANSTRAFNGALLNSGRPVLVLGRNDAPITKPSKIMYAWNGQPESAKAIHHSLNWIEGASQAHIVLIDPDEYQVGPNPGDDVAALLARRNLTVTVDRLPSGGRDAADVLLEHAYDIGADLVVMGAYGHSRFREWLLGGTTRTVLDRATCPVLMAH